MTAAEALDRARYLLDARDEIAAAGVGYADRELADALRAVLAVVAERDAEIARMRGSRPSFSFRRGGSRV